MAALFGLGLCTEPQWSQPHPSYLLSWSPHRPHIIRIFELIAGNLLLVAGAPPIRIFEGVEVGMGVKPTGQVHRTKSQVCAIPED